MVTQNLNQTGLKAAISSTIDHAARQQILDYLISAGIGYTSPDDGATIPVEVGAGISNPDPDANVLIETNANNTIKLDPKLKAIIEATKSDVTLTVNGAAPVLIATGAGNDEITFNNNRGTTVLAGAGNDTVYGGGVGHETMDGGAGNDCFGAVPQRNCLAVAATTRCCPAARCSIRAFPVRFTAVAATTSCSVAGVMIACMVAPVTTG